MGLDIAVLGASRLTDETNLPVVQTLVPLDDSAQTDAETFGEIAMFSGPGCVTARPYPTNDDGWAEGVVANGVAGHEGVLLGWRDKRSASVYAALEPGDSALHGTGPNHESQVRCQEQMVSIVVGDDTILLLDRKNGKFQVAVAGYIVEVSKENGAVIASPNGQNGIRISDEAVHVFGTVVLGGLVPQPAMSIMLGPVAGSPGGPTAAPLVAAKGVFIGL